VGFIDGDVANPDDDIVWLQASFSSRTVSLHIGNISAPVYRQVKPGGNVGGNRLPADAHIGPGKAKRELGKRLESQRLGGCIVSIETVDKMTDRQIASKVRQHFRE